MEYGSTFKRAQNSAPSARPAVLSATAYSGNTQIRDRRVCRICRLSQEKQDEIELIVTASTSINPIGEAARQFQISPRDIGMHFVYCRNKESDLWRSEGAARDRAGSIETFGLELVEGVRRCLSRAEEALVLALALNPADVDAAKAMGTLAKTYAQVLDGALARAERKALLERLEAATEAKEIERTSDPKITRIGDVIRRRKQEAEDAAVVPDETDPPFDVLG